MWHTPLGDRVLEGAEARLVAHGISLLAEGIEMTLKGQIKEDEDIFHCGPDAYTSLTVEQRAAALHDVAHALLDRAVAMPEATAALEATVAAIYAAIGQEIQAWLDAHDASLHEAAKLVARAMRQHRSEVDEVIDAKCDDWEEWDAALDQLTDLILWDRDFDDEEILADLPPAHSAQVREEMRMPAAYGAPMRDPSTSEAIRLVDSTRRLAAAICGD
jgi:hypothetical protein